MLGFFQGGGHTTALARAFTDGELVTLWATVNEAHDNLLEIVRDDESGHGEAEAADLRRLRELDRLDTRLHLEVQRREIDEASTA